MLREGVGKVARSGRGLCSARQDPLRLCLLSPRARNEQPVTALSALSALSAASATPTATPWIVSGDQASRCASPAPKSGATRISTRSSAPIPSLDSVARPLRYLPPDCPLVEVTCRTIHGRMLLRPSRELNRLILRVLARSLAVRARD